MNEYSILLKVQSMNKCKNCQSETSNPLFCSRTCNGIWNNKYSEKLKATRRIKTKKCELCDTLILSTRVYCDNCNTNGQDMTLKNAIYKNHHKSSAFALVRTRARAIFHKLGINKCQKCGYNKHIEVCHIKPISEFQEDTMISKINHPDNLLGLCPNCHWEHDNL